MFLWVICLLGGCGQTSTTLDPAPNRPFREHKLSVFCSLPVDPHLFVHESQAWSREQDCDVRIERNDLSHFSGDVALVRAAELPTLVETGQFLPVPDSFRQRDHFLQWEGLLPYASGLLASWNGTTYGIPLRGEGYMLVYRLDRFKEAKLTVPQTWEEFVTVAQKLATPERPSLPRLPASAIDLETTFYQIAACYDRPALNQSESGTRAHDSSGIDRLYSFHDRLKTGESRIDTPAFRHALELLQEMQPFRGGDFATGGASLAIVSLQDIARFQAPGSPIRNQFGIAPLPGARLAYDFDTGESRPTRANEINRVPYIGADIIYGLVSRSCKEPEMAFAFLADLAHPEKSAAEIITAARWGAGPLRVAQTDERARGQWLGYDLTHDETEHLLAALKQHLAPSLVNHRFCLRTPTQDAQRQSFERIIRPAIVSPKAEGAKALEELKSAWKAIANQTSEATRRAWSRDQHGLNRQE